jgi:hypothetical protein
MKKTVLSVLFATLASCGKREEVKSLRRPETEEERKACAKLILEICEASNPKSDEEPEDMIKQAQKTAWETLCQERDYKVTTDRSTYAKTYELLEKK